MQTNLTITQSDEIQVDLSFLYLENKINEYWSAKGWPTMIRVRDATDDVVLMSRWENDPPEAMYIRSKKTLYRLSDLGFRWRLIRTAFVELITDIKIIE